MRTRFVVPIAIAMLTAVAATAAQRTFVSAASGVDTNPCTRIAPCRTFAAAMTFTDPNGEVVVLDSGGYGPVTITQAVSLISPAGVHAGITSAADAVAITVNAGDTAAVVLRNLTLTSQEQLGGTTGTGVLANSVKALYVEGCTFAGFHTGIYFSPTTSDARLYVSGCILRRQENFMDYGIEVVYAGPSTGPPVAPKAVIDSTQIYEASTYAIAILGATAVIRDCVLAHGEYGVYVGNGGQAVVDRTTSVENGANGFNASQANSVMVLSRCLSDFSGIYGVFAEGKVWVSDCTITNSGFNGIFVSALGNAKSRGNNTLQNNVTNGSFTSLYPAQ